MKRVTAFVGSSGERHTYEAVRVFLGHLEALGDVACEVVMLGEHTLHMCEGCKQCFEQGEGHCPFDDDRDLLIGKMAVSDGVVFASPNYSFQVSALMKVFLERLGYVFHRPQFFGKSFTSIVTQGVYGGDKIVEYLDFVGSGFGFNTVKGNCLTAFEPMTEDEKELWSDTLKEQSRRFYDRMNGEPYPVPSLFKLMAFRMGRTSMQLELDERSYDYRHYRDKGWFETDYYYPVKLGLFKRGVGYLFDRLQARLTRKRG